MNPPIRPAQWQDPRPPSPRPRSAWWGVTVSRIWTAVLLVLLSPPAIAAPHAELWQKWQAHDDTSTADIDHSPWNHFLQTYVRVGLDGIARIPYARVSGSDRAGLAADLSRLAALPINVYSRREQFAFWIDLYNELTVKLVLDHYPVSGIRDIAISPGLFSTGPWGKKLITIEGEPLSLDDIEHRILRPIWRDPRVHYAVNCAALGCPNLQSSAFTAANTEALLDKGARDYVNDTRGATVGAAGLTISSLYIWYEADFGGSEAGIIEHLKHYARPKLATALAAITRISADRYDWALNDLRE